jgi:hypothetical protein
MRDLSGTKLVMTCVKKALGVDQYCTPPAASSSELTEGVTLLACNGMGLMKRKKVFRESWSNTPSVGTDKEAAGDLRVHGLWREGNPGY